MRKRVIKAFFSMALSLAVVASFMSSSVQAEAKGVEAREIPGVHHMTWTYDIQYEEANSEYHFVNRITVGKCNDAGCNVEIRDSEQIGYEKHDLRGVAQAPLRWYCVLCGYAE